MDGWTIIVLAVHPIESRINGQLQRNTMSLSGLFQIQSSEVILYSGPPVTPNFSHIPAFATS